MAGDDALKPSSSGHSLNFGNPLYLHSNDTGGSHIVTVKLTGTKNYKMDPVKRMIMMLLLLINGICVILLCLLGFLILLSPDLYDGAIYAKYAYELWNDPKETYDKVDGFAVFNLHKNINSLTQSGYSLAEYYNNLNSLWNAKTKQLYPLPK
ncbi:hypothetical protein Tco_0968428 [Tanacetum coccineum]